MAGGDSKLRGDGNNLMPKLHSTSRHAACYGKKGISITLNIYRKNSVALVRKWITPTERPPLVDEVSVNFCGLFLKHSVVKSGCYF
jgi:hypothetical protein